MLQKEDYFSTVEFVGVMEMKVPSNSPIADEKFHCQSEKFDSDACFASETKR